MGLARAEGDNNPVPTVELSGTLNECTLLSPQLAMPPHVEMRGRGFYAVVDYIFMTNLNKEHDVYTDSYVLNGITAVAGWQWRTESAVGLGFSYLYDGTGSFTQIPVFMEFRTYYSHNRFVPFTAIQLGYSVPFGSQNDVPNYTKIIDGGLTVGLDLGMRLAFTPKVGMNFFVGYQMIQNKNVERGVNSQVATRLPELYHNVKAGIGFNF